jgi:hypothetical protein
MGSRRLCASVLASLVLLGALLLGQVADGYVADGRPWPGGVIRYYNAATDQAWAVQRAVNAWNASGARVKFVAVPAGQAQVRIEHFPRVACTINAEATIGYGPNARVWVFRRDEGSPYCNSYVATRMIAHELGHVLGLAHETRGCALMNPETTLQGPTLCRKAELWQWRCKLLTADDVAGAVALYGGTARAQSGPDDCDLYSGIQAPAELKVTATAAAHEFRIDFRRPPSIAVPRFLLSQHTQAEAFVTGVATRRCATDARKFSLRQWHARPGGTEQTYLSLPAGLYCLSVWAVDSFIRPSPHPAMLWVRIT